ncbi:sugar porter family MFS transporter [Granulicella cerasi]|uniref:Sugar porter family MFS transporter n=1 Tax=Granulicella cerasi TaxID=741063 RepID=A0ABW1Z8A2_9BACT|nr:sugar porter family MFS transporter [Granulicella cerasi]
MSQLNRYLIKSTLIGALGGLLFGFDTAVIAGTTEQLSQVFHLTPHLLGWTVAIGLAGTVLGALTSGALGQRIGGRDALRIMAVLYCISSIGCAFAWNWDTLLVCRFIGGIGIGGSSVLGPVYIAELAPAKWRGRMVGLFQFNIVIGILLAYSSNYLITLMHFGAAQWRWEFGVAILPSAAFLVLLFAIPRSSRWLVTTNNTIEAREVLELMGSPDSDAELDAIIASVNLEQGAHDEPLFSKRYSKLIVIAISIGLFNQLSGVNAILYYANYIFSAAGYSASSAALQTVGMGLVNIFATLLGMSLIDKLGRKTLLLTGALGTAVALAGIAVIFHTHSHASLLLVMLVIFMLFFAVSQGSVIWVYLSEIFPSRVRSKGQSVGSSSHWIMNAIIAGVFPSIAAHSQAIPFAFFSAMMLLQFVVVLVLYPETKGKSLEAIQAEFHIH